MGWLRRSFRVPDNWDARRIITHFEGVAGRGANLGQWAQKVGEHFDSFLPFEFDITDYAIKRNWRQRNFGWRAQKFAVRHRFARLSGEPKADFSQWLDHG